MAGQYKTRCPHCGAQFKISDEHLGQARGAVRCGACLQIFQATDHLIDAEPPRADQWEHALDDEPAGEAETGDRYGDADDDERQEPPGDGGSLGDSVLSDSFLSLEQDDPDEGLGEDFSSMSGAGRASLNDGSDEAWAEALLQDLEDEEEPVSTPRQSHDDATARKPEPDPEPEPEISEPDQYDFLGATPSSREVANERLDYAAGRYRGPGIGAIVKWGLLSLLAIAVLAGQYAFFHFDRLARSPQWRPLYAQACHYLGCRLPLRSDVSVLRGANLVVRSDPDYRNALMVDALLYNEGHWPQPFPVLELTFNDLKGQVVASRRFGPAEYLHGKAAGMSAMPVDTPIHVSLQIVDPGDKAVSYNLRLLPANETPRRVSQAP